MVGEGIFLSLLINSHLNIISCTLNIIEHSPNRISGHTHRMFIIVEYKSSDVKKIQLKIG